tara:strand:- start:254 stop:1180 length:927 start_codon:yes stop_codon:yes gene_type:complete
MLIKCRNKEFHIYSVQEAIENNIEYRDDWRYADKGDWVLTSDNMVIEVVSRRKTQKKDRKKPIYYIRTGFGEIPTYKANLYAKKYPDPRNDKGFMYEVERDVKPTILQKRFLDVLVETGDVDQNGMWTNESIINAYQTIYSDNNPTNSLKRGNIILKKKRIKEHMSELMKDKLTAIGLDDDYVAENLKKFVEDEKITPNVRLSALNRVSTLLGHDEKKIEQLEGVTTIAISEGDKKMLAEFRKELSDKELDNIMKFGDINGTNKNKHSNDKRRSNKPGHTKKTTNSGQKKLYPRKRSDKSTGSVDVRK